MVIRRIFIVANNRHINARELNDRWTLTPSDLLVRCNHCAHLNSLFPNHPFVWVVRRDARGNFYRMKEVPHAKVMEVVTMITPPGSRFYTKSLELIPDGAKHSRIDSLPVVPTAKTGNASTGFAAYVYFSQKYPDAHIYLLGWTFHHDQPGAMWHDFHAEKRAIMEAVECGNVFITS